MLLTKNVYTLSLVILSLFMVLFYVNEHKILNVFIDSSGSFIAHPYFKHDALLWRVFNTKFVWLGRSYYMYTDFINGCICIQLQLTEYLQIHRIDNACELLDKENGSSSSVIY